MSNVDQAVAYDDLRGWMNEAERLGELKIVPGASWEREIGLASEIVGREDDGPALLFDEIPGYAKGLRVLSNIFGGKRRNATLGFADHLSKIELSESCYEAFVKASKRIEPETVSTGPVFENIIKGEEVNVLKFPTPIWHPADGGRYIGTGCYSVTRDPDDGTINVGCYRAMVIDSKTISILMIEGKHGQVHQKKYFDRGQPMPVALVVGGDPLIFFAAGTEAPAGVNEFAVAGGMRGRATRVVKGPITGLPFPAAAEIVFEGYMHPQDFAQEGPFGEWTGYYVIAKEEEEGVHTLRVDAIYHRDDPIILGVPPIGGGSDEMARYRAVLRSAMVKQNLLAAGVPDVTGVWCHEFGASRLFNVVSIRQRYMGHSIQAGLIAGQCGAAVYSNRFVVVVDEDIDVTNLEQVMWAICTRCDPATAIQVIHGTRTSPADPRIPPEQRATGNISNSRAVIDACRPYYWKDQFPKMNALSPKDLAEARSKFEYLLR